MKYFSIGSYALLLSPVVLAQVIGVAPKDQELYVADENQKWKCLSNPEIELDFSQINDDYCDCPDGSDEPGTNACPNTSFYCENKGHVPSYIKGSLVNDGKCDYELCCDGSDEWNTPVHCENKCEEMNKKYQDELKLKNKIYTIGADKAFKTLRAANRLRSKLEEEMKTESAILRFTSRELANHQGNGDELRRLERSDSIQKSLKEVENKILGTYDILIQGKKNLDTLGSILKNVADTFNENLNDAAVALTVDRYNAHVDGFKEEYLNDTRYDVTESKSKITKLFDTTSFEASKKNFKKILTTFGISLNNNKMTNVRINDLEVISNHFIENYNPNFNDLNVKEAVKQYQDYAVNKPQDNIDLEILASIKEEIRSLEQLIAEHAKVAQPELSSNIVEVEDKLNTIDRLRYNFRQLLDDFLGLNPPKPKPKPLPTKAENQEFIDELQRNKDESEKRIAEIEKELARDLGPHDILRPLEDIALNGKIGEYDYEVYFLKDLRQKGANNHDVKIGQYDHYEINEIDDQNLEWKLFYSNGAKCWNGPKRSAVITVTCGENNELLSVSEPEKCEYHFRLRAPIGCRVPESI